MSVVYIHKAGTIEYPPYPFEPEQLYPEYPFPNSKLSAKNEAYAAVRDCLIGLELDKENYGSSAWNPLRNYLSPGQTVLIKPNLVMDHNENNQYRDNLDCLVTHPSCLRAVCDYCVIALKNQGKIIIADAPMQGCQFDALKKKLFLKELMQYYAERGVLIEVRDLREYEADCRHGVIAGKKYTDSKGVIVHLGKQSAHYQSGSNGKYQVSDYSLEETQKFHHADVHDYYIAETVLQADLIINFSKPKTHRLAGFTGAMKNMVGITYNKASLPHRTAGSPETGGDAYRSKSLLKKTADHMLDKKILAESKKRSGRALFYRYAYCLFRRLGDYIKGEKSFYGSWPGNETIWRTILDLNRIISYADKNGVMQSEIQRKILCFGDMIIAGERNGPVAPTPKKLGIILASDSPEAFDIMLCKLMGFRIENIPLIREVTKEKKEINIRSNVGDLQGRLEDIEIPTDWTFEPHDMWK